jgi:thermitase
VVLLVTTTVVVPAPHVYAMRGCADGEQPRFQLGFGVLRDELGDVMGVPVTCEYPDANGSSQSLQETSTGLAIWDPDTNTPTFTNGYEHWALTGYGLVSWTTGSPETPAYAADTIRDSGSEPSATAQPSAISDPVAEVQPLRTPAPAPTVSTPPAPVTTLSDAPMLTPPAARTASIPASPISKATLGTALPPALTGQPAQRLQTTPTPTPTPTPQRSNNATPQPKQTPAPEATMTVQRGSISHTSRVPQIVTMPDGARAVANRLIVRFADSIDAAKRAPVHQYAAANGVIGARGLGPVGPRAELVEVSGAASVSDAIRVYTSNPSVVSAEPDLINSFQDLPNDPMLPSQWGLAQIRASGAWDVTHGSPSRYIAILDSGIFDEASLFTAPDGHYGHPDLRGKVALRANFSTESDTDDWADHGTDVAGIAAAVTGNGVGVAGVGYNVRLFNVKVGSAYGASDSAVVNGLMFAANNGAHVANLSLGRSGTCPSYMQDAIDYAWGHNTVVVAAAGNNPPPSPVFQPASCNHVLAVTSTDSTGGLSSFAATGTWIELAAPGGKNWANGQGIVTTDFVGTYATDFMGTSAAAPQVSGVAALVWSSAYGTSAQAVAQRLTDKADRTISSGIDYLYGRVNAAEALAPTCSPRPPVAVTAVPSGGRLLATVSTSGAGVTLRSIQFTVADNAAVDIGGLSGGANLNVVLNPGTTGTNFSVRRLTPGAPTTVQFTVIDSCGSWPSLVGGGPAAF